MMHCTARTLLSSLFGASLTRATTTTTTPSLPAFLVPALSAAQTQSSSFSTSGADYARKRNKRDRNPARGVSALRRTGLKKQKVSIRPSELPKPVLDPGLRSQLEVDENHGLWEFFPANRTSMATPEEIHAHGRAWTIEELRPKDWEDLHKLWWTCVKERNRLLTYANERTRWGPMYGDYESEGRHKEIKRTMKRIKYVLTERWYSWENARVAAMEDPEINMFADLDAGEAAYLPKEDNFESDSPPTYGEGGSAYSPLESPNPEARA